MTILNDMNTDQKICYKLVNAENAGELPTELQEVMCGTLNHSRGLQQGSG